MFNIYDNFLLIIRDKAWNQFDTASYVLIQYAQVTVVPERFYNYDSESYRL